MKTSGYSWARSSHTSILGVIERQANLGRSFVLLSNFVNKKYIKILRVTAILLLQICNKKLKIL